MGFIKHYRGRLRDYTGPFHESMLMCEVGLDDFLAERYPPFLLEKFPEQARADREREQAAIEAALAPGDALWQWRRVDASGRTDGSDRRVGVGVGRLGPATSRAGHPGVAGLEGPLADLESVS
jgi:hypothetical protein